VLQGLLIENAATNSLLNSGAPVTQTTGSLATGTYTLWMDGTGSAAVAGTTATITGAGTASAGVAVVFQVTVAGTVTVTVTGSPTRFQLENLGGRTSYIPTTGTTATRAIDVCTMALPAGFGSAGFSVVSRSVVPYIPVDPLAQSPWSLDDGSFSNYLAEQTTFGSGNIALFGNYLTLGVFSTSMPTSLPAAGSIIKLGLASVSGDFAFYKGGAQIGVQSALITTPVMTILRVGSCNLGAANWNGAIQGIDLYNYRLSNTTLASLTT
jgi:hypothetical protein